MYVCMIHMPPPSPHPSHTHSYTHSYTHRALFDYDSTKDDDRPTAGLTFKHGDILHILNGNNDEWWQAALVGNHADDGPQGLIPSKKRCVKREEEEGRRGREGAWVTCTI